MHAACGSCADVFDRSRDSYARARTSDEIARTCAHTHIWCAREYKRGRVLASEAPPSSPSLSLTLSLSADVGGGGTVSADFCVYTYTFASYGCKQAGRQAASHGPLWYVKVPPTTTTPTHAEVARSCVQGLFFPCQRWFEINLGRWHMRIRVSTKNGHNSCTFLLVNYAKWAQQPGLSEHLRYETMSNAPVKNAVF